MKKLTHISSLPLLTCAAGLVGALARAALYLLGRDASGLLPENHPMQLICWVLTAGVALSLWLILKRQKSANGYRENFPGNPRVFPAAVLAAAGILITLLANWDLRDELNLVRVVLGILSCCALVLIGIGRRTGNRLNFCLYGVLCLFYAVHMIGSYKLWSGNPQTEDYCFALLACACLTLSAYQRTAFCAEAGSRRSHLFICLMAGYFCILCLPAATHPLLYLTSGCFFLTDLALDIPHHHEKKDTP